MMKMSLSTISHAMQLPLHIHLHHQLPLQALRGRLEVNLSLEEANLPLLGSHTPVMMSSMN